MTDSSLQAARDLVDEDMPTMRADLRALVRIPSVSAEGSDAPELARSAQAVSGLLSGAGMPDVRVLRVPGGAPAVVGRLPGPEGAPTVLLYAHHDVQPAGDRTDWTSDPFELVQRDSRLVGRGAADDKAAVVAHAAAVRALGRAFPEGPPVGVTVFVEGEEEVGSPTLQRFLGEHADLLVADVVVIADSMNWDVGVPAFTTSLRGLVEVFVEVRTHETEQHSGVVGGLFPDAFMALARMIAALHDEQGRVAVPGLVRWRQPQVDVDEAQLRARAGVGPTVVSLGDGTAADRLWSQPAVSVVGIDAPPTAMAANVLLPVARAKVSLRIAPGQDPAAAQRALTEHLVNSAPWGVSVTCEPGATGAPVALTPSGPHAEVARASFRDSWDGVEPVLMGIGGSIPFIADLADTFPEATILVVGPGDPASNWHGPNESVDLGVLGRLTLAELLLLIRLGGTPVARGQAASGAVE